ncbi:MAG: helix-turn-helix domain-containing protein [Steroidobacteraceae bacterium]
MRRCTDTIQVWPKDPLHFDGQMIRKRVGRLALFEIRCGSIRLQQTRKSTVSRSSSYQVLMPLQGRFALTHGRRSAATVDAGSLCLIDRTEPYEIVHGDGLCAIGVEFPRSLLESCMPQAARAGGAILRPQTGSVRLLANLMRALGAELSQDQDGALPSTMARSIAGFVAVAFSEKRDAAPRKGIKAQLAAYREYVEARLGESDLRPVDLAREFHVSERYVRLVFQSSGESLSDFLIRRRLERAALMLRSAEFAAQTVTDIALECGFNTASHFGYRFRQTFGTSPREFRRAALG